MKDINIEELLTSPKEYILNNKLEKTNLGNKILNLIENSEFKKIDFEEQKSYIINVYKGNEIVLPPSVFPPIDPEKNEINGDLNFKK